MSDTKTIGGTGNLRRDITLKIAVINRHLRTQFDQRMGELGVTRSQWSLIAVVSRREGATQRTIAEVLEISEAAAGRLIDKLCGEGLLERRPKEDDRRAYRIVLTEKAQPILDKVGDIATVHEDAAFAGFADSDLDQLGLLLDAMYRNLNG